MKQLVRRQERDLNHLQVIVQVSCAYINGTEEKPQKTTEEDQHRNHRAEC